MARLSVELEEKIAQKGLESSIILKPFSKTIQEEYAKASIYAMTSYYEALPMVLLEAGSLGLLSSLLMSIPDLAM